MKEILPEMVFIKLDRYDYLLRVSKKNENLKCCGNCDDMEDESCICNRTHEYTLPYGLCEHWNFDNKTKATRENMNKL